MARSEQSPEAPSCRICGAASETLGQVHGKFSGRSYELRRCVSCRYSFIADPWTEFERIYDDRYYAGQGVDPMVDYRFELEQPERTVRRYEWEGITRVVDGLLGGLDGVRWLDFGCGNGGLVRYVLDHTSASACGFEEGSIVTDALQRGIPILSAEALTARDGQFDVVSAIEVLEHTLDPLVELRRIRRLLRPGGLLFLTTGNAGPYRSRMLKWPYVLPEIHISFFEPETLDYALHECGFEPAHIGLGGGFEQILKFKVLKNLRIRRRSRLTDLIPARPLAVAADHRVRLSRHPIGWAA